MKQDFFDGLLGLMPAALDRIYIIYRILLGMGAWDGWPCVGGCVLGVVCCVCWGGRIDPVKPSPNIFPGDEGGEGGEAVVVPE